MQPRLTNIKRRDYFLKFLVGSRLPVCNAFKGLPSSLEISMKYEEWGGSENLSSGSNLVKNNPWKL